MKRWLFLLSLAVLAGLSTGCGTTSASDPEVSTIPWNRPQGWEGQGSLGGMTPPGGR